MTCGYMQFQIKHGMTPLLVVKTTSGLIE